MGRRAADQTAPTATFRRDLLICLGLAAITWVVYFPACQFEFVDFDDNGYVFNNYRVKRGLSLENLQWGLTTSDLANWHPLMWYSLMLDASLFGENAGGYHVMSILFHTANTLLLFVLLKQMTAEVWKSAFVAALFAIHPLHVESVAWVSERKDVLSMFFGLLAMMAYCRYARAGGWKIYGAGLTAFCLSLAAKPMLVTLPFLLLLFDYWPLKRTAWLLPDKPVQKGEPPPEQPKKKKGKGRNKEPVVPSVESTRAEVAAAVPLSRLLLEKLPFFLVTVAFSIIAYATQSSGGAVASADSIPLPIRIANAVLVYGLYLLKTIWPVGLAAFYPHPKGAISPAAVVVAALILVAVTVFVILQWRKRPYLPVGWFWYLGTLIPVIGIVQIGMQQMADRYTYFPLIGFFVAVTWLVPSLLSRTLRQPAWLWGGSVTVLVVCMILAREQVNVWQNSLTLFNHTLAVTKNNFFAHNLLGMALTKLERTEDAIEEFKKSLAINPNYTEAHSNLGAAYFEQGRLKEAVQHFETALEIDPTMDETHVNMGVALFRNGFTQLGFSHLQEAVKFGPRNVNAHINLGNALEAQNKFDEALEHFRQAVELDPDNWLAHLKIGERLQAKGDLAAAEEEYRITIRLKPEFTDTYTNMGTLRVAQGREKDAIEFFEKALQMNPRDQRAREFLQKLRGG